MHKLNFCDYCCVVTRNNNNQQPIVLKIQFQLKEHDSQVCIKYVIPLFNLPKYKTCLYM